MAADEASIHGINAQIASKAYPIASEPITVRISDDREHGFHGIMSNDFRGS
jgi:hypothetical protein